MRFRVGFLVGVAHLALGLQCGPQPQPPKGSFNGKLPPDDFTPSTMQCGPGRPYPWQDPMSRPVCPPAKVGNLPACTCFESDFLVCPQTTSFPDCPKNSSTGHYDSVREDCYGVVQPRWNWILSSCDSIGPGGASPIGSACDTNPYSTADVNYLASYQLEIEGSAGKWVRQNVSSFNADNEYNGLAPLGEIFRPSVGADWGTGYYMASNASTGVTVPGVGPPGALFVFSFEKLYNVAYYLLNQISLDRCPDCSKPNCRLEGSSATDPPPANCWGDAPGAEAGEIDILETPFWDPTLHSTEGYNRYYLTSGNSKGFCNPKLNQNYNASYNFGMGGHGSNNFFEIDLNTPHIFAVVLDATGITAYRDPVWPGITSTTAAPVLDALRPTTAPYPKAPCTLQDPSNCARYSPVCVTNPSPETTYKLIPQSKSRVVPCPGSGSFGMSPQCISSSWWNLFADTGQYPVDVSDRYNATKLI